MKMLMQDKSRRRYLTVLIFFHVCCFSAVSGFSDGSKLAKGSATTRTLYCNRQPNRRDPMHFNPSCNGYCPPRSDFEQFYNLTVSNTTYWLDVVRVNISAKPNSGKSVTGFSVYAIDESGHVAGSFVEDDTDVVVGTCNDLISVTDETHAGFHKMADHARKNVSIQWQPDGYNHGRVKFVLWVVNNHSDIYFMEYKWLTSQKHGSDILDIGTTLDKVVSAVDIEMFENTFKYRSTKGYNLDLTNPFSAFSRSPSKIDLVPVNLTRSGGSSNLTVGNSKMDKFQPGGRGTNASSILEVASVNASDLHAGKVQDSRDMNSMKLNNANDTKMFSLRENNSNSITDKSMYNITESKNGNVNDTNLNNSNVTSKSNVNDTNLNSANVTNMINVNDSNLNNANRTSMSNVKDTSLNTINGTSNGIVNDTNFSNMNGASVGNANDTNLSNMNGASMGNANDTNLSNMNGASMGNVNDTNPYTKIDTNTNSITNDTVLKNSTLNPVINGSQTTQLNDGTNLTISTTTQIPVVGTEASQLKQPGNTTMAMTPISTTPNPDMDDSQATTGGNKDVYTATSAMPDAGRDSSPGEAALRNPTVLNTSVNSGTTSSSGSDVTERATTAGGAGYSTAVYQGIAGTKKSDISTTSLVPPENTSSNNTVFLPAAM